MLQLVSMFDAVAVLLIFSFSSRDFETSTRLSSKDGLSAYIKFVGAFKLH